VILYEMLAGAPPHDVSSLSIVEACGSSSRRGHCRCTRPGRARALDDDVATIVAKALEKDASNRYGSAAAPAKDIRRWLGARAPW
jgi:serine/threonine protein kinase